MPTAIEKVRDGLGVSLNRRANAPLSGRWDAMELGTAAAVPERGSPSPTRVYAQLVPRTVLDKWATYRHHYLNIVSASTATNAHTPLCFGLLAQMLFSLLTA
ncbi:hypothetical protein Tcan_15120 [Toxocara canis]|nr:hypothetical protein Tcan_15120 [Toxocara canis]